MLILSFSNSAVVEDRAGQEAVTVCELQSVSTNLEAYLQSQKKMKWPEGLSLSNRCNNVQISCKACEKIKIVGGQVGPTPGLVSGHSSMDKQRIWMTGGQQISHIFSAHSPEVQVPFPCSAQSFTERKGQCSISPPSKFSHKIK